ncbi:hypothetical protein TUM18999_46600 [Pseudomonas tohonis]|uniref:Uncharacterized protein n=1 Tax=Pseudomonas tohonis TaxID=2725477 RepID=A0A6J4EAW0_9PSED|nr:hypothetical protein [Pseudomonas tohonis]BCG26469.1 hypothetical protein TUM18999_46600 [Pseudomonas tohonis]GJN50832.1 hypothetical protein TUM20286_05840 [Pseudomonas tohonis]
MINSLLIGLAALLCILVVLAALDYLRAVSVYEHPVLCLSFYLVAIGAFGGLVVTIKTWHFDPYSALVHSGLLLFAFVKRRHIFRDEWGWTGAERRRS